MDQRAQLRAEIDATSEELAAKLRALEERARDLRHRVKHTFDLEHHAQTRPWTVFGAAVGVGFVIGWLTA